MTFFVYVLRSERDGRLYTGMTDRLERRLKEHNAGKTQSTRYRRPFTLLYTESYGSRAEAARRERFLKSGAGHKFLSSVLAEVVPTTPRETGTSSG
jgi:putative endonuclease